MNKKELEMVRERLWDEDTLHSMTSRQEAQMAGIRAEDQTRDHIYLVAYYVIYKINFYAKHISYDRREVHRRNGVRYAGFRTVYCAIFRRHLHRAKWCQVRQAYAIGVWNRCFSAVHGESDLIGASACQNTKQ